MLLATSSLSQSPIWQLEKNAYARLGVESWAKGRVPFQMTNNSRLAAQYAKIILAAFPKGRCTILELGGGSGKFAFLLLRELSGRNEVRYYLTDGSEKNLDFCKNHPKLKPWIDRGILKISLLDPLSQDPPQADFVIANYFFDSIPHDLFRVERGEILEGQTLLEADVERIDWDDPTILSQIQISYDFCPLKDNPYPDFPLAEEVLEEYRRFEGLTFLFPIGSLRTIRRIESFLKSDFLFLAADRGPSTLEGLQKTPVFPSLHGSAFSLSVNFHAIGRYMKKSGGSALFSQSEDVDFTLALLSKKASLANQPFETQVFGPLKIEADDFPSILKRLEEANWDATLFFSFFDSIEKLFNKADPVQRQKMREGMRQIRDRFFPLFREEAVLLERLGFFFQTLGEEEEAAAHFALAARFDSLPEHKVEIGSFLDENPPRGEVLQISSDEKVAKAIKVRSVRIAWGESSENLGLFDTIYLFPPSLIVQKEKPAAFQEIEKQFSLDTIQYSDADIEFLFSQLNSKTNPKHVLQFFIELERKKNISREQFDRVLKRLGATIPLPEEDRFFETLLTCIKYNMKAGSTLHAFISGMTSYDDGRFFEEVVVNPHLEIEERPQDQGIWITVRKL